MAIDAREYTHYMRVVPNSQSFGSLNNILVHYDLQPEEITKDYLLVAFKNTLEHGLEIQKIDKTKNNLPIIFKNIDDVIHLIKHDPHFTLSLFVSIVRSTVESGYDLEEIKQIKTKMKRKKVYKRIDTERQYQDLKWSTRRTLDGTPDEQKPPAEWINYMEHHISAAKKGVYELDTEEALAQVRKVAALAVRCLELHGCPKREIPEELKNQE